MAYTPYYSGGWQSGEAGGTPITPEALNHIEDGIQNIIPADIGIKAGTRVSQFAAGSASFAPSDIGLTGKPNCLILTLSSNAATNPPTYDTFLSYDWDDSTDSTIVIKGYKANGTAAAGYIRYSYIAIQ